MILCCVALLGGCADENLTTPPDVEPTLCTETFDRKPHTHEIIGFYPSWKHNVLPVTDIRWDALTRIIYAFGLPATSGHLLTSDLTQAGQLVAAAHAHGVEVYLSVGGGAGSGDYPAMASDASSRSRFVFNVADYLGRHCLDGVDIDWESWTKDAFNRPLLSEMQDYELLLEDLRAALDEAGLKMSIDIAASNWFGQHISDAVEPLVDEVHVMAYDFSGPWSAPGPHSSYEQAIGSGTDAASTGLAYWSGYRAWPIQKTYLGVPFYGRDFDTGGGQGIAYRDIVAAYPYAPDSDRVANIYYNGVATMEAKTRYVIEHGYPGIMIWEIAQDTDDPSISLLSAVERMINLP